MKLATLGIGAGAALFLGAIGGAIWFLPDTVMPASYVATDCRRVPVTTPDGPLAGAEDIALSPDGRLLYISAYDRLAVEEALEEGYRIPDGGLYVVPVSDLDRIDGVSAIRAIEPFLFGLGLRPHGIDYRGGSLAMVNRGYTRDARSAPGIVVLRPEPGSREGRMVIDRSYESPVYCAANDIAVASGVAYVTLDRARCPGWATDELLGLTNEGRLIRMPLVADGGRPQALLGGLAFPNGVALVQAGPFRGAVVAETRRSRLLFAEAEDWIEIPLPGGPDNLSVDADGMIIAAVHPSLSKLALYRYGWTDNAPTRIVRVNPISGEVEVLFDDPGGLMFSGASSALMAGRTMVAGSVRDEGLLICRYGLG